MTWSPIAPTYFYFERFGQTSQGIISGYEIGYVDPLVGYGERYIMVASHMSRTNIF